MLGRFTVKRKVDHIVRNETVKNPLVMVEGRTWKMD